MTTIFDHGALDVGSSEDISSKNLLANHTRSLVKEGINSNRHAVVQPAAVAR